MAVDYIFFASRDVTLTS